MSVALRRACSLLAAPLLALFLVPGRSAIAQAATATGSRNVVVLEANPFRGTLSYARRGTSRWEAGASLGFGFPQLDLTLDGRGADFRDYAHLGAFARRELSPRALLELGARVGVADYHHCTASDCWPGVYAAPSVMVAVGGRRLKLGTRLTAGVIRESNGEQSSFLAVSPLNLLVTWRP